MNGGSSALWSPKHTQAGSHWGHIRVWSSPSSLEENIQMFRPEEAEERRLEEKKNPEIAKGCVLEGHAGSWEGTLTVGTRGMVGLVRWIQDMVRKESCFLRWPC